MTLPRASEPARLLKISALARESGVPAATIKHYLNEGLLPLPARTSRNMAYYDAALVPRIRRIKDMQRTRFLPLKVIKQVLDEAAHESPDETVSATLARVLEPTGDGVSRSRKELEASGLPEAQLDYLLRLGAVRPDASGRFAGDDLEILRVLGAARKAGISEQMLPLGILGEYAEALRALVRAELRLFREGVVPRAGEHVAELTEVAAELSERLVVLLRRKLILPTLRALTQELPARPGVAKSSIARKRTPRTTRRRRGT